MTYAQKLQDHRWLSLRLLVLERDDRTCRSCDSRDRKLHVHHLQYSGDPWDSPMEDLITLCEECHDNVETAIKMIRGNPHIIILPHIVNRTLMLHGNSPQMTVRLLKSAIKLCEQFDELATKGT